MWRASTRASRRCRPSASSRTCWCAGLGVRWLLVGRDFRFGARRAGDFATLKNRGFALEAMPDVEFDGVRVSSSAVRAALKAGELAAAERLLGHPYTISGRVAHGAKLGRGLGFPTANIVLRRAPPLAGSSWSKWTVTARRGEHRQAPDGEPGGDSAARSASFRPRRADLYGEHLRVRFLKKLRDEEKYDGLACAAGRDRARRAAGARILSEPWLTTKTR